MNSRQTIKRRFAGFSLALIYLLGAVLLAVPQENAKPSPKKWRPKAGAYAEPGETFMSRCTEEDGDLQISWAKRFVSGYEWGCSINKITDTASDALKLDLTCHDVNMPETKDNPHPEDRQYKEIMLLNRIDERSMSVRKTTNGVFGDIWRADYCSSKLTDAEAQERAESKWMAIQAEAAKNPWHLQDGIYAILGANFEDRCLKGGDATIDLTDRLVSRGTDKCSITFNRVEPKRFQLFVTCRQEPAPPRPETIFLKRTAAKKNIVLMQMSRNREFSAPEEEMSYCGPDAQKLYAQQKAKN